MTQCCAETGYGVQALELNSGKQYENRKDLGNIYAGDGVKYKGAGYIQVTGRGNYQAFSNYVHDTKIIDDGAPYVAENYAMEASCFWWKNAKANDYVDSPHALKEITMLAYAGSAKNTNYSSLDDGAWKRREVANETLETIFN